MIEYELFDAFIKLVFIISIIWGIYWFFKQPYQPMIFEPPKNLVKDRTYILRISNITPHKAFSMCLKWLTTFSSKIIKQIEPFLIIASQKFNVTTISLNSSVPITFKDIPKIIEFNLREYVGTDTEVTLKVSLNMKQRDVQRHDFIDLDWYKQELLNIFKDYEVNLIEK